MWCYPTLDDALTIEAFVKAISQKPRGAELLVASSFNADLADPYGNAQDKDIITAYLWRS